MPGGGPQINPMMLPPLGPLGQPGMMPPMPPFWPLMGQMPGQMGQMPPHLIPGMGIPGMGMRMPGGPGGLGGGDPDPGDDPGPVLAPTGSGGEQDAGIPRRKLREANEVKVPSLPSVVGLCQRAVRERSRRVGRAPESL